MPYVQGPKRETFIKMKSTASVLLKSDISTASSMIFASTNWVERVLAAKGKMT